MAGFATKLVWLKSCMFIIHNLVYLSRWPVNIVILFLLNLTIDESYVTVYPMSTNSLIDNKDVSSSGNRCAVNVAPSGVLI